MVPTSETKMVGALLHVISRKTANTTPVLATQAIANVVKSSFGPSGLDKMMVDDIGVRRRTLPYVDGEADT